MFKIMLSGVAICGLLTVPAVAQDADSPLSGLYSCADITDDAERLACYDAAVGRIQTAEQNKEIVAIDTEKAESLRREAFGFNLPSLPDLGILSDDKAREAIIYDVRDVEKVGRTYYIYMENGQVWKDTTGDLTRVPRGDLKAEITPAMMGSYKMNLMGERETLRSIRVARVE